MELQSCFDRFRCLLVAGLVKQGKHVLLVCLHARLVEGVHAKDVAGDTAGTLEEINQLAEIELVEHRQGNLHVGHPAVHVRQHRAEFCHLVHLVHALAGEEVQSVEVCLIVWEIYLVVRRLHRDNGLKLMALAVLDILSHRVQVGGEVHACREDTLTVFAF